MAYTPMTPASGGSIGSLKAVFAKVSKVYYFSSELTKQAISAATALEPTMELPVLEDSVSFESGAPDVSNINLTTGDIWTSRETAGEPSISLQVASIANKINKLFLNGFGAGMDDAAISTSGATFNGYKMDGATFASKKSSGALIMLTNDANPYAIILPNVDLIGSLVVSDGDNPAYFNVQVTPKLNTADSVSIFILRPGA